MSNTLAERYVLLHAQQKALKAELEQVKQELLTYMSSNDILSIPVANNVVSYNKETTRRSLSSGAVNEFVGRNPDIGAMMQAAGCWKESTVRHSVTVKTWPTI